MWAIYAPTLQSEISIWATLPIAIVMSLFPDIDMRIERFEHRRETHSVIVATVACFFVDLASVLLLGISAGVVFTIFFIPWLIHVFLDMLNFWPMYPFWPEAIEHSRKGGFTLKLCRANTMWVNDLLFGTGIMLATFSVAFYLM